MLRKRSICFVGLDNYPVLTRDKGNEYFGGESVQQTLLAKAFRDLDYEVSMIVMDYGQPQAEIVDGIRVWKAFDKQAGIPLLRFFHPRATSIFAALGMANADFYYQSCAGMVTGLVAAYCRRHGKRFIFRLASDSDCIPGGQIIRFWRDRKLYEFGLRRADIIASQTLRQASLLKEHYNLDSVLVNMVVEPPGSSEDRPKHIDILWVNNLRDLKRPQLVLDLAKTLPDYRIVMIGGPVSDHESTYAEIQRRARDFGNLEFMGPVPYHEIGVFFSHSKILINTSEVEGFPNSFLQAWVRGVPVISFFDPDGLIQANSLGKVPRNLYEMASMIVELLQNEKQREYISAKAETFALQNYSPATASLTYDEYFEAKTRSAC